MRSTIFTVFALAIASLASAQRPEDVGAITYDSPAPPPKYDNPAPPPPKYETPVPPPPPSYETTGTPAPPPSYETTSVPPPPPAYDTTTQQPSPTPVPPPVYGCTEDSCYQAVKGPYGAKEDCGSLLASTVTPSAKTVTITSTVSKKTTKTLTSITTIFSPVGAAYVKRADPSEVPEPTFTPEADFGGDEIMAPADAIAPVEGLAPDAVENEGSLPLRRRSTNAPLPTALPAYATQACNPSQYSSVCSCLGVQATTITLAPPAASTTTVVTTRTTTRTATRIVETTVPVCDPAKNFGLEYSSGMSKAPTTMSGFRYAIKVFDPTDARSCCVRCFNTPGCFTYDQISSGRKCRLYIATAGKDKNNSNTHLCPNGILLGFPHAYGKDFGLGPCNTFQKVGRE